MFKINFLSTIFFISFTIEAQIGNYNHFPTLKPFHILDDELRDISFALSMRVLESEYNGPLIRLRRANDDEEKDFHWGDNDKVDINAINAWRNGNDVFVHTWYDQSSLGRNAVQTEKTAQPQFFPEPIHPYFQGDGFDDYLIIDTANGLQDVTNAGNEATIIGIIKATVYSQNTFGVNIGGNRWSSHLNWNNNRGFFDPGPCCNDIRSFPNKKNKDKWAVYTFMKTNTNSIVRVSEEEKYDVPYSGGRCTLTEDFTIGWGNNGNINPQNQGHSTTGFLEFIMYRTDISEDQYLKIEKNSVDFWGL